MPPTEKEAIMHPIHHSRALTLLAAFALLVLAACSSATSAARPTPTVPPTTTPVPTPTLPPAVYAPVLLTQGFGCPDDLAQDPAGNLVFSDQGNGTVNRLTADGHVTPIIGGLNEPEGVIYDANGTLLVGEQGDNGQHIDQIDQVLPGATTTTRFLTLKNATNTPGVDSLSLDPRTGDLIVADSPNGTLLRISRDGQHIQTLAHGFVRPVDAIADAHGTIFVADEYGNAVLRVAPDGTTSTLIHLPDPDDLAFDLDGTLLVTVLGDNTVRRIDPATGKDLGTLARNLFEPQGLLVDVHGNLYVSEETANAIVELVRGRTTPGPNLPGLSGKTCR